MRPARVTAAALAVLIGFSLGLPVAATATQGKLTTRSRSATAPDGQNSTVTATCRRGSGLVGGGFRAEPATLGGANHVFESRRVGRRSWRVSSSNASGTTGSLTAIVYCRVGAPRLFQSKTTISIPSVPGFSAGAVTTPCPPGSRAVAGGFLGQETGAAAGFDGALPFSSRRAGLASWLVRAVNTSASFDGGARSVTAFAYCAGTGLRRRRGSATAGGAGAATSVRSRRCPKASDRRRLQAMAGGFDVSPVPIIGPAPPTTRLVAIRASVREKARWRTSVTSLGDLATTVTSYGYCG
jgi:hypothetical protein